MYKSQESLEHLGKHEVGYRSNKQWTFTHEPGGVLCASKTKNIDRFEFMSKR